MRWVPGRSFVAFYKTQQTLRVPAGDCECACEPDAPAEEEDDDMRPLFFSGLSTFDDPDPKSVYLTNGANNTVSSFVPVDYALTADISVTKMAFNVALGFYAGGALGPDDSLVIQLRKNGVVVPDAILTWDPLTATVQSVTFDAVSFVEGDTIGIEAHPVLPSGAIVSMAGTLS